MKGGRSISGRNNKPINDEPSSSPDRLDQYGDKLASQNEEEFEASVQEACEAEEK